MDSKILTFLVFIIAILEKVKCDFIVVSTTEQPNGPESIPNNTHCSEKSDFQNSERLVKTLESISKTMEKMQETLEKLTVHKHVKSTSDYPTSCNEIKEQGIKNSGFFLVKPKLALEPFTVFCDMEIQGGGWTYFLNRFDGSQDFYQNWDFYKNGFGSLSGEFWLGLEHLHEITGSVINELLVELTDHDGQVGYALYDAFVVGNEEEGYNLKVLGNYSGNAGDSLRYQSGMKFTTKDKDQDGRPHGNCAVDEHGGYWYNQCTDSNLTAMYLKRATEAGYQYRIMYWNTFRGSFYSLKKAKMMVRPRKSTNIYR